MQTVINLTLIDWALIAVILAVVFPMPPIRKGKYNKFLYNRYLKSNKWKRLRKKRFRLDKGRCQKCNKRLEINEFNCHHTTYARLYFERLEDVETLCIPCHKKIDHRKIT